MPYQSHFYYVIVLLPSNKPNTRSPFAGVAVVMQIIQGKHHACIPTAVTKATSNNMAPKCHEVNKLFILHVLNQMDLETLADLLNYEPMT